MVLFAGLAAAGQLVGCASIVNGQNQSVAIETRDDEGAVPGAACTLVNDKGKWFITTPGSAVLQRSFQPLAVRCEKSPMEPGLATVNSGVKGMMFGNLLFGGIIGAGVDHATGAAYDYPVTMTVLMGKNITLSAQVPPPAGAASAPAVTPAQAGQSASYPKQ